MKPKPWSFDPLTYCHYYKKYGCAHVDGYLCNVNTCTTLKEFNREFLRTQKLLKIKNKIKNELHKSR